MTEFKNRQDITEDILKIWEQVCEDDNSVPILMINQGDDDPGKFHLSIPDGLPPEMVVESVVGSFMAIPGLVKPFLKSVAKLLGATKKYPAGKLSEGDDGQLRFTIGIDKSRVIMDFGTKTAWLGLGPEDAIRIGKALIENAKIIAN